MTDSVAAGDDVFAWEVADTHEMDGVLGVAGGNAVRATPGNEDSSNYEDKRYQHYGLTVPTTAISEFDVDRIAVAGQGLIDGVVDHLIDEEVQAAGTCGAHVHIAAFAGRFDTFQNGNVAGNVVFGFYDLCR
nr:hypothetical protein [Arthrobacter sp. VKM Ac-2550]